MGDQDKISQEHQTKDHYWEYFDSMTTQRTQVFYFYVVIASLFWTGLGATESRLFSDLKNQKDTEYIAEMIILCFFVAVTFVFYMIEERCIQIVKFAECYIIKHGSESDRKLFILEPESHKICGISFSFKTAYGYFFLINIIGCSFTFLYFIISFFCEVKNMKVIETLLTTAALFILIIGLLKFLHAYCYKPKNCILESKREEIDLSEKCICKNQKIAALNAERLNGVNKEKKDT